MEKTRTKSYEKTFDTILVIDFGGQYSHLISRRIREQNVYSEIVPCTISASEIKEIGKKLDIKGIILSGGPQSVYSKDAIHLNKKIFDLGLPILGLCYGHQIIAYLLGGRVSSSSTREYGSTQATIDRPIGILQGLERKEKVWMSHTDSVMILPNEFEVLAHTENCRIASFRHKKKPIYGLQWHPEVAHTEHGIIIIRNFLFRICECRQNWDPRLVVDSAISEIKEMVGDSNSIIALSGGIDSSTATILSSRALDNNLTAIFVDHGFMREGEPEFVKEAFEKIGIKIRVIEAKERFLNQLKGITDPEKKRKIIGREFIKVFEAAANELKAEYLIQGTIYPDRIESGFKNHSAKIKTHHNVGGIPNSIKFKSIIEPLRDLYKDEVRKIAESLGLPDRIISRQPFPGPGLAVRIMGEVDEEKLMVLKKADKIVAEEIEKEHLDNNLWQYFAVLTNTYSTGIRGDSRAYGYVLAIRAVESKEAMTASFAEIPYHTLENISTRLTNELEAISRVVYDITHKPPATIEWE